ncbi:DNRLRE domain-containing protein [Paenibacillaceae bacterium WGS1546]|uniref:DNRLRE domain-containing protein n=1 Tax=Cohnella sp. WGS1546 TaxID=3366810 RepID=UPI00372CEE7F
MSWQSVQGQSSSGYVNVGELPGGYAERSQALAVAQIWSPAAATRQLSFGSDYWAKVDVNGELALDRSNRGGPPSRDEVRVPIQLRGGWNDIAVRLSSGSRGSGFWFGLDSGGYWEAFASAKEPSFAPNPPARLTLPANGGTYVDGEASLQGTNFAHSRLLRVSAEAGGEQLSYAQWDLSGLSPNLQVVDAEIVLKRAHADGQPAIRLFEPTQAWEAGSATYGNRPTLPASALASATEDGQAALRFGGPAIAELAEGWLRNPAANRGIALATGDVGFAGLHSDDHDSLQPKLIVHYAPSPADLSLSASEATYSNSYEALQHENFGSADVVELSETASARRIAYVKWDLGALPPGKSIANAELVFNVSYAVNVNSVKLHAPAAA